MVGRLKRLLLIPVIAAAVALALILGSSVSTAQLPIFTPSPEPSEETPEPTLTPPPESAEPSDDPVPSDVPIPGTETPLPDLNKTPKPKKDDKPDAKVDDDLPEGLDEFPLEIPSIARTRPRNTVALVRMLEPLAHDGLPLEQVLVEGMGRFPVAGLAHYSDDWLNPRFTPKPHLHHGLDIFADFGTPIRAPDDGVISFSNGPTGGIGAYLHSPDGTKYYFAHLLERAADLVNGQRVKLGTVLGFVGDSGNAKGGTPHLHFQIHPGGGAPVPPKPTVDAWLDEAEKLAPQWVKARQADISAKRQFLGSSGGNKAEPNEKMEASLLLTLLDPVGGSVGLLPTVDLKPSAGGTISDRLIAEIIKKRVEGRLFFPSDPLHLHD